MTPTMCQLSIASNLATRTTASPLLEALNSFNCVDFKGSSMTRICLTISLKNELNKKRQ